jgi:hypothetical protein
VSPSMPLPARTQRNEGLSVDIQAVIIKQARTLGFSRETGDE